jgi:hypothetical protein
VDELSNFEEGIKWIHEERDLKTVFLYFFPEGKLSLSSWLRSYKGKRTYAYAAWDDPMPFLTSMRRVLYTGGRRLRRQLFAADRTGPAPWQKPRHVEDLLLAADPPSVGGCGGACRLGSLDFAAALAAARG